jgi:hypothetical protein
MKRLLVAILIIVILVIGISGYTIYSLYMIKPSKPPAPIIFSYSENYWTGLYAFSFAIAESSMQETVEQFLVIMDYEGKYLNYEKSSRLSFNYINQLSENEIYYYLRPQRRGGAQDPESVPEARIWNFQTGATRTILEGINIRGHHEFLIEDEYFVTLSRVPDHEGGLDTIVHLDPETGNETWVWSSEPYFPEKICDLCRDDDWTHGNDVTISLDGKYYYINFRNTDSFAKVDRETRETVWFAGRNGNFTLFENGVEKESLWYHSHIIKEVEPNVFIMFDNDLHNRTHLDTYPPGEDPFVTNYGGRSRLIEITLDESTMTGEVSWSYTPEAEYFSAIFGDIDILPNGNILGIFGTPVHKWTAEHEEIEEPFGASLLEVNRDGELIREYRFPLGISIYRVQQLSDDPADYVGSWLLELP